MKHPSAVTACNLDLENLVTDSNRSIATLAITTLLKTGSESSIDRLMKQISSFMSEISDEFKVRKWEEEGHRSLGLRPCLGVNSETWSCFQELGCRVSAGKRENVRLSAYAVPRSYSTQLQSHTLSSGEKPFENSISFFFPVVVDFC